MGLLVLGAPLLVGTALTLLLAGSFLVDGFQRAAELLAARGARRAGEALVLAVLGNLAAAALLLLILWTHLGDVDGGPGGRAAHLRRRLEHGHDARAHRQSRLGQT